MTPPLVSALVAAVDPEWLEQLFALGAANPNPEMRTLYEWRCYLLGNVLRDASRSLTRHLDVAVTLRPETRA